MLMSKTLFQAAQSEAGKKGAAISAARSEEDRKAAGQKAAETRYEGFHLLALLGWTDIETIIFFLI